jgi:uncharacterized protein (DUF1778 family)
MTFFRTGLVARYSDDQLVDGLLSAKASDPMSGIRFNALGREILDTAARNQGMSQTEFMRKAIYEALQTIYTETEIGED